MRTSGHWAGTLSSEGSAGRGPEDHFQIVGLQLTRVVPDNPRFLADDGDGWRNVWRQLKPPVSRPLDEAGWSLDGRASRRARIRTASYQALAGDEKGAMHGSLNPR
jgi:hypothetical protein